MVVIVTLQRARVGFEEEVMDKGYEMYLLPGPTRLHQVIQLRDIIRSRSPSLVYTSLFDADLVGRFAAMGTGVPVISNLANTTYDPVRLADPLVRKWKLHLVRLLDAWTARHLTHHFHAVSHAVKSSAIRHLGVREDRITVIERGRDAGSLGERSLERRIRARQRLGLPQQSDVLVTVGRQEYQKGHVVLLRAMHIVAARRPNTYLLLAGREGSASDSLRSDISRLDLSEHVRLLGHRNDIPEVLAASDIFVFPSLYEGLGGAVIEAMALGLPIIASDLPALREVADEGSNVDFVPPSDEIALAEAVTALLSDSARRKRYGERSRAIFMEGFQASIVHARLLEMFDQHALPR